jgi:hypothetical protein
MVRLFEKVLLLSVGIFIALVVITFKDGAIPTRHATLNMHFLQDVTIENVIPTSLILTSSINSLTFDYNARQQVTAVRDSIEWLTSPIRTSALVLAGILFAVGILYLWLRIRNRDMSEDVFP